MPIAVLEHISGDKIPAEWREMANIKSDRTFKVIFVPDDETNNPPKPKIYGNDVKRIYAEAMQSLDEDIKNGLTREKSFKRLKETMTQIGDQIKQNEKHG